MTDIASCVAGEVKGVVEVIKVYENTAPDNLVVDVSITIGEGQPPLGDCDGFSAALGGGDRVYDGL